MNNRNFLSIDRFCGWRIPLDTWREDGQLCGIGWAQVRWRHCAVWRATFPGRRAYCVNGVIFRALLVAIPRRQSEVTLAMPWLGSQLLVFHVIPVPGRNGPSEDSVPDFLCAVLCSWRLTCVRHRNPEGVVRQKVGRNLWEQTHFASLHRHCKWQPVRLVFRRPGTVWVRSRGNRHNTLRASLSTVPVFLVPRRGSSDRLAVSSIPIRVGTVLLSYSTYSTPLQPGIE